MKDRIMGMADITILFLIIGITIGITAIDFRMDISKGHPIVINQKVYRCSEAP